MLRRGYGVDVGVVEAVGKDENGKSIKKRSEIDFIVNLGQTKVYIQPAFAIQDQAKREQETYSFRHSGDFFKKIVVENGVALPRTDADGLVYVGVIPFLLHPEILE